MNHKQSIPQFHAPSYYAGITAAFCEIVANGVKQLALSPPYTDAELAQMMPITYQIGAEHGVTVYIDADFLVTPLFDPAFTAGKHVILLAQSEAVVEQYLALKAWRKTAVSTNTLHQIARQFGHLLSYSDTAINQLIN